MILLLVAILSATSVMQGSVVNITLYEPAHVILDGCMYFEDTFTREANLTEGTYSIVVTYSCEGMRQIVVKGATEETVLDLEVTKVENPEEELKKLDSKILQLNKDLKSCQNRIESLEKLVDTLNSMNVELYDRLREYKKTIDNLKTQLQSEKAGKESYASLIKTLNESLKQMKANITKLQRENEILRAEVSSLSSTLTTNEAYMELFKILFFFTLAFLVGTYFSILRR
jgi:predicted RNase H-like nuclease (RuvC/YqgF family)